MNSLSSLFSWRHQICEDIWTLFENTYHESKGSIVLIKGKFGVGKTTLIKEFKRRINMNFNDVILVETSCTYSSEEKQPFISITELIKKVDEEVKGKGSEKFYRIFNIIVKNIIKTLPEALKSVPGGTAIGSFTHGVYKDLTLEKKDIYQEGVFTKYKDAFIHISEKFPLVLILEDIQWIDQSSANFLSFFAPKINENRIFVIVTYSPELILPSSDIIENPLKKIIPYIKLNVKTLELESLSSKEVGQYISAMFPNHNFDVEFENAIYKWTNGNFLFLTELIKSLKEKNIVLQKENKWISDNKKFKSFEKELRDTLIPGKVESFIKKRISDINNKEHLIYHRYASVEGEKFSIYILKKLFEKKSIKKEDFELIEDMNNLEILYHMITSSEQEYDSFQFVNLFTRLGFYNSLNKNTRIFLHKLIGTFLEDKFKSENTIDKPNNALTLARHFELGNKQDKAIHYYSICAEAAEESNAFTETALLYEELKRLYKDHKEEKTREQVDILKKLSAIYEILGLREQAYKNLEEALELNKKIGNELIKASNLTNMGITSFHLGEFSKSKKSFEDAQQIYKKNQADLEGKDLLIYGITLNWLGINYRNSSEFETADKLHRDALKIAKQVGDPRLEAHANANLGAIHLWKREFSKVNPYWKVSYEISQTHKDLPWEAHYGIDVGYMSFLNRKYDEALEYLDKGIEISQKNHFRENLARGLMNKGNVFFAQGNLSEGRKCYERALQIAKDHKIVKLIWRLEHNIGNVYRKNRKYQNAYKQYLLSVNSLKEMLSKVKSNEQKGFLNHRLDPFKSMILLLLEQQEEDKALKYAKTLDIKTLMDYYDNRRNAVNLNDEEKKVNNLNYFDGYYVITE